MPLWIESNPNGQLTQQLIAGLRGFCHDPALSIDWGSTNRALNADGRIIYDNPTSIDMACVRLAAIAQGPVPVVLRARSLGARVYKISDTTLGVTTFEWVIAREQPGFTRYGIPAPGETVTSIDVILEPSNDLGRGHWVVDEEGKKISEPLAVIIAHELAHVEDALRGNYGVGLTDAEREERAIEAENEFRRSRGMRIRVGHEGGYDLKAEQGSITGGDCFVATAAYGAEFEDEVQELRSFRDDVLRRTRAGDEFFEAYYEKYYKLSPAIVTLMHTDPEIKELVRWSLVAPLVNYLRLAKNFPRASTADVPEPWRGFLETAREGFEQWTTHLPRPRDFADLALPDAAEELRVTLEHFTWRDDDAAGYVAALEAAGALPLQATPDTLAMLARTLDEKGARPETIRAITGIGQTEGEGAR